MRTIAIITSFYLFAIFYFGPRGIIGGACENIFRDYSSFHTFTFHHLAMLYFMLSVTLKQFNPDRKDIKMFIMCMSIYFFTALCCSYIFDTNYINLLRNNITFMENLRLTCGQIIYTMVMGFLIIFSGAILLWGYLKIKEKKSK